MEDSFLCYLFDRVYSYFDWRASSDSSSQNLSSSVRRWAVFGLIPSDSCFFCPKGGRVRTHSLGFLLLLSEGGPCSDSFSRILASSVRRCSDFGLILSDSCFFCPKMLRLRTQLLGIILILSEGGRVRTHSLGFLLLLSEGASTSDSIPRILA